MDKFNEIYLSNKNYPYKVIIDTPNHLALIAVFKVLDFPRNDNKDKLSHTISWSLKEGILNTEYVMQHLNFMDTESIFNKDFSNLKISFDIPKEICFAKSFSEVNSVVRTVLYNSYITKAFKSNIKDNFSQWSGVSLGTNFSRVLLEDFLLFSK